MKYLRLIYIVFYVINDIDDLYHVKHRMWHKIKYSKILDLKYKILKYQLWHFYGNFDL